MLEKSTGMVTRSTLFLLIAGLFLTMLMVPVAASQHSDDKRFSVELFANCSAEVTIQYSFDLNTDAERTAFNQLRTNQTVQDRYRTRFLERMERVAARTENATGREMSASQPAITFDVRDNGATGVAILTVDWSGLAKTSGKELVVTEPFASGFEPDRQFVIRGPAGYKLSAVTPEADSREAAIARWNANTSLDGFRVAFAPADTPTPEAGTTQGQPKVTEGQNGPGFGVLAAIVALAVIGLWRRSNP